MPNKSCNSDVARRDARLFSTGDVTVSWSLVVGSQYGQATEESKPATEGTCLYL
jgi:hypothetical protein